MKFMYVLSFIILIFLAFSVFIFKIIPKNTLSLSITYLCILINSIIYVINPKFKINSVTKKTNNTKNTRFLGVMLSLIVVYKLVSLLILKE